MWMRRVDHLVPWRRAADRAPANPVAVTFLSVLPGVQETAVWGHRAVPRPWVYFEKDSSTPVNEATPSNATNGLQCGAGRPFNTREVEFDSGFLPLRSRTAFSVAEVLWLALLERTWSENSSGNFKHTGSLQVTLRRRIQSLSTLHHIHS